MKEQIRKVANEVVPGYKELSCTCGEELAPFVCDECGAHLCQDCFNRVEDDRCPHCGALTMF